MKKLFATVCLFFLFQTLLLEAQLFPLSVNSWKNEDFQQRFMGSYGTNNFTEPQLDVDNYKIYESLVNLVDNPENAIQFLTKAIVQLKEQDMKPSAALYFVLANLHYEQGDHETAVKNYISAIRSFPSYLRAYANLGFSFMELGESGKALPMLLKAIELGSNDSQIHGLIGYIYMEKELYSSALSAYEYAMMFNPKNNSWRKAVFHCLVELEKYQEALGVANELLYFDKKDPELWISLGSLYARLKQMDKAIAHYEVAHHLGGGNIMTHRQLGSIYFNDRIYSKAFGEMMEATTLAESEVEFEQLLQTAVVFAQTDQIEYAVELADEIQHYSENWGMEIDKSQVELLLAKFHYSQGKIHEAESILEGLMDQNVANGEVYLLLGNIYKDMNSSAKAEVHYGIAKTFTETEYRAYYETGRLMIKQTDIEGAIREFKKANSLRPTDNLETFIESLEKL